MPLSTVPEVAEAAAVPVADHVGGRVVEMYVCLYPGIKASSVIEAKVNEAIETDIGEIGRPENIWIVPDLPRSRSGEIVRGVVAAVSNFADVGDTTMLVNPESVEAIRERVQGRRRAKTRFSTTRALNEEGSRDMSLHDVYSNAWVKKRGLGPGWIVNLEPNFNLELGAVGILDGQYFSRETTLKLRKVTGLKLDNDQRREETPWQFNSNNRIQVGVSASEETSDAVKAAGEANWNVSVNFGKTAGVSIHGAAMWWNEYADLGIVRTEIIKAAREERLHKGESIVVAQQLTGPGVVFLAEGKTASLTAAASVKVAPGAIPPVSSFSGKLSVTASSNGAQFQSFTDKSVLAARLLYLGKRGWLWSRRFEVFGTDAESMDKAEMRLMQPREGNGEYDYFALL